jgi:hypothetical protein
MFYKKRDNRVNKMVLQGAILMSCVFFLSLILALNMQNGKDKVRLASSTHVKVNKGVFVKSPSVFSFSVITKDKPFYWQQQNHEFFYKDRAYGVVKSELVNGKLVLNCIENCFGRTVSKGLIPSTEALPHSECASTTCAIDQSCNSHDTVFVFIITPEMHALPVIAS